MTAPGRSDLLRVLGGEQPARRPVWFMRQAGRCLPEYRRLRERHSFEELLRDAEVAAEVTLMPLERFDLDAAILFTDLLVPLEAMGVPLAYKAGPELGWTVRSRADLDRLRPVEVEDALAVPLRTARLVRDRLAPEHALLGFVGAPWTLAAYLVEGRGSKDWSELRRMGWRDGGLFRDLLDRVAGIALEFGLALARSGCDAVQVFDSWAGVVEPGFFARSVLPPLETVVSGLAAAGVPVIYFLNGAATHLDAMAATGADCLGLDWKIPIADAHARLPPGLAVQGNLDPQALFAPRAVLEQEVRRIVRAVGSRPHVFNLGHGLDPRTPLDGIDTVLATLRSLDQTGGP